MADHAENPEVQLSIDPEPISDKQVAPPVAESPSLVEFFYGAVKARIPSRFTPFLYDFEKSYLPRFVRLERNLFKADFTSYLQKRTGVHGTYWSIGGAVVGFLCVRLLFKLAASLCTNLVGFVYPAYASIKAIESEDKEDDTQWLTYWTVYGGFSVVEYFSGFILEWIPFYYVAKIFILLWCFHPATRGAGFIYQRLIRPYFLRYHKQIDDALEKGTSGVRGVTSALKTQLKKSLEEDNPKTN